jgi:hypothetical protein
MHFRGTKIFDEFNDDDNNIQVNQNDQRIPISKYMVKDSSNMNYSEEINSQNFRPMNNYNGDSFNENNNNIYNQISINNQMNASNNNLSEKISMIKILISNYLKEKELDT